MVINYLTTQVWLLIVQFIDPKLTATPLASDLAKKLYLRRFKLKIFLSLTQDLSVSVAVGYSIMYFTSGYILVLFVSLRKLLLWLLNSGVKNFLLGGFWQIVVTTYGSTLVLLYPEIYFYKYIHIPCAHPTHIVSGSLAKSLHVKST